MLKLREEEELMPSLISCSCGCIYELGTPLIHNYNIRITTITPTQEYLRTIKDIQIQHLEEI